MPNSYRSDSIWRLGAGVSALSLAVTFAGYAMAQSAPAVEEVIVTAQKREERLQDVPIAVTAFSAKSLEMNSITNLNDLTGMVPNVTLESSAGFPNTANFTIRALSNGSNPESTAEPAVGVSVDGVYWSRAVGAVQDLFDIDSIEVLRGPQGTLYGRNTIGGVINIHSKAPSLDEFGAKVQMTFGDNGRQEYRGMVSVPLIQDQLAVKLVLTDRQYDGFYYNTYYNRQVDWTNSVSGRFAVQWVPSANFDVNLSVDHTRDRDGVPPYSNGAYSFWSTPFLVQSLGYTGNPNADPWTVSSPVVGYFNFDTTGVTVNANWNLGFATLTSVTGWREFDDDNLNEYGGAPINFVSSRRLQTESQMSEELRLSSSALDTLSYVVGLYYLHTDYDLSNNEYGLLFGAPNAGSFYYGGQKLDAYAFFGQLDYHITDALTVTGGWRYSTESKSFYLQPLFVPTWMNYAHSWNDFSPKGEINYKFSPELMAYFSVSRGFRSGGFNGRAGSFTSAGPYDAENVTAYEAGFKSEILNHRVRLNGDVFMNDYTNMQLEVQRTVPGSNPPSNESFISNAGSARIYGAELEAHALITEALTFDTSIGYLHARFGTFIADLDGTGAKDWSRLPLPFTPKWSFAFGPSYRQDTSIGTFTTSLTGVYNSDQYATFSSLNAIEPFSLRPSYTTLDGTISWEDPKHVWRVSLWSKNLTNEKTLYTRSDLGTLAVEQIFKPPRTWGIDLSRTF